MKRHAHRKLGLSLPPLAPATAAWLVDLCGQLQHHILQSYGAAIEAHWAATEPEQLITGQLEQPRPPRSR